MATLLRRSSRSSTVPQAASCLAAPLEPPAHQAAAKDRHVHSSAGRHQVANPPFTSFVEAPFATPSTAMLSAHYAEHEILRNQAFLTPRPRSKNSRSALACGRRKEIARPQAATCPSPAKHACY